MPDAHLVVLLGAPYHAVAAHIVEEEGSYPECLISDLAVPHEEAPSQTSGLAIRALRRAWRGA